MKETEPEFRDVEQLKQYAELEKKEEKIEEKLGDQVLYSYQENIFNHPMNDE